MKKIIMILSVMMIGLTSCEKETIEPLKKNSNDNITSPIEDTEDDYVNKKQLYIEFYNAPTTVSSLNLEIYAKYEDTTIILPPLGNNRNSRYYNLHPGFEFVIKTDYFNDMVLLYTDKIKLRLNYDGNDYYREYTVIENNQANGIKNEFFWYFNLKW